MIALIIANNPVTLSFAEAVLKDARIDCVIFDQNMSILEPGLLIPKRLCVIAEDEADARAALIDAGLGDELEPSA